MCRQDPYREVGAEMNKHTPRLQELGAEARRRANKFADEFANDYSGKVLFALTLAHAMRALCNVTPGLREETFVDDARRGTMIWVEEGEPKTRAESKAKAEAGSEG